MSERSFRFITSIVLLCGLYFNLPPVIFGLIALYTFEGLTNWRVPILISRWRGNDATTTCDPGAIAIGRNLSVEAEQILRIILAVLLFLTYIVYKEQAWFVPWLLGFALLGAAITGVCPCILGLKQIGFR